MYIGDYGLGLAGDSAANRIGEVSSAIIGLPVIQATRSSS
jgi:hypothetical protein